jgi:hypothetical protein
VFKELFTLFNGILDQAHQKNIETSVDKLRNHLSSELGLANQNTGDASEAFQIIIKSIHEQLMTSSDSATCSCPVHEACQLNLYEDLSCSECFFIAKKHDWD